MIREPLLAAEDAARTAVVEMATALGMVVVAPEDAERLAAYDRELSAVMPHDFNDWWENSRAEWPLVARMVIENHRLTDGGWPDAQEGGAP